MLKHFFFWARLHFLEKTKDKKLAMSVHIMFYCHISFQCQLSREKLAFLCTPASKSLEPENIRPCMVKGEVKVAGGIKVSSQLTLRLRTSPGLSGCPQDNHNVFNCRSGGQES